MGLYLGDKLISSNLAGGDTNPIGSVIAFAGQNAPVGYLMCDGSAVSRETYADLFAVIGTTYGAGDGSTTFNLPDAQGRTLVGVDGSDADFDLADTGGAKGAWKHRHYSVHTGSSNTGLTNPEQSIAQSFAYQGRADNYTFTVFGGEPDVGITSSKGSDNNTLDVDKANMPPFLSLNYIIKATHNVTIQRIGTIGEDEMVEKKTLLWENPNPNVAFVAQTINSSSSGWSGGADLSEYDAIEIKYAVETADHSIASNLVIPIGKGGYAQSVYQTRTSSTYARFLERAADALTTGVKFYGAYYKVSNSNNAAASNSFMIPLTVHGIKKV